MRKEPWRTTTAFSKDVAKNTGYLYTTNASLSSYLANKRLTDVTLQIYSFTGKKVLDVGCGDGTYTLELFDRGQPLIIHGLDPTFEAIKVARQKVDKCNIAFLVGSAYRLPYGNNFFDVVHLRGVLHHLDDPLYALREAFRVAPTVVVIEPNGLNPGLKFLEKYSTYHIEHGEKSYRPSRFNSWVNELGASFRVRACRSCSILLPQLVC